MAFKMNPITGQLDLVSSSTGAGDVVGPSSATDHAIARYDGTTGKLIEDSITNLQDGGAIEAQGFITVRAVTSLVSVTTGRSWIAPELELELSGAIEIDSDGELIII